MFQHFGQRLKKDLKGIVDARLAASETASGSLMRSSGLEVNVISHKMQRYAVWYGGSLLGSLPDFYNVSHGDACPMIDIDEAWHDLDDDSLSFDSSATQKQTTRSMVQVLCANSAFSGPQLEKILRSVSISPCGMLEEGTRNWEMRMRSREEAQQGVFALDVYVYKLLNATCHWLVGPKFQTARTQTAMANRGCDVLR